MRTETGNETRIDGMMKICFESCDGSPVSKTRTAWFSMMYADIDDMLFVNVYNMFTCYCEICDGSLFESATHIRRSVDS